MTSDSVHERVGEDVRTRQYAAAVVRDGFVAVHAQGLREAVPCLDLASLASAWQDLPPDDELPGGEVYRYRRYGRLRVDLSGAQPTFEPLPHTSFQQDAIPLWHGRRRVFAPIPTDTLRQPGLLALVGFDARLGEAVSAVRRWTIGLHLVRIVARAGAVGRPTPEGRHRDGHMFVGMHLVERDGCRGGRSVVHPEHGDPVQLTLAAPLDSMFVADERVTHEVTPIEAAGRHGHRDVLLVDLNPTGPDPADRPGPA